MHVETLAVGLLGCNCSIVADLDAKRAIVIDPGGDYGKIEARLRALGVGVDVIVHTHTHLDHVGCTAELQRASGAAASIHEGDRPLYDMLHVQSELLGLPPPIVAEVDGSLVDGRAIRAGALEVGVVHTPGHTPGSCCFLLKDAERTVVFAGDTLFRGSIGRTDLGGIDQETLVRSIRSRLLVLPDDTHVVCGHGASTTIGTERRQNPFLWRG
ncbi:MAG TPA: MBL fold metallo-hydrolase [Polyangiaceae bacterium]|nr:MBL fold metallo-hydrolase [Polyangiaceae bacterium]